MNRFLQYLRPNGQRRDVEIERPPEIEAMAERFIAAGGRYECEELRTGHVSLTAAYEVDGEYQDIASQLCHNGPAVPGRVDNLIRASIKWLETTFPDEPDGDDYADRAEWKARRGRR